MEERGSESPRPIAAYHPDDAEVWFLTREACEAAATAEDPAEKAIVGFYRELLGREPDQPGLQHWLRRHRDEGWSLERIRQGFLESAEYQAKVRQQRPTSDDPAAKATAGFYRELLGREPEPEGLAHWLGQYRGGRSLDWIRARIDESPERQLRLRQLQQRPQPSGQ